jgi:hypothetical protein
MAKVTEIMRALESYWLTHANSDPQVLINANGTWHELTAEVRETGEHRNAVMISLEGEQLSGEVVGEKP